MEEKKWCVYIHTSPSNKAYIGITCRSPEKRWGKNGRRYLNKKKNGEYAQPIMANAILKYNDWDAWEHNIFQNNLTKEEACYIEKMLIGLFDTRNKNYGYNISIGGDAPMYGRKFSEETKKKMSNKHKGENHWNFGRTMSEETKRKIAEAQRGEKSSWFGRKHTKEELRKMSESQKGHVVSENTRIKMSDAAKKRLQDPENHPLYGKHHSEETKEKLNRKGCHPVVCIETGTIYFSIVNASKEVGVSATNISKCCRGKQNMAGGYHWRYATKEEAMTICV